MSGKSTAGQSKKRRAARENSKGRTDWRRLERMSEGEIDAAARADPDAPPTDAAFWQDATLVMPETKERVTMRMDRDVLRWFKARGRGYQTRINAVLRSYVEARR